ncbi:MAG TPA: hypothetical protein VKQ32_27490 [Polyangia bacterium]|nr:hypothetical protein [Polyangia bacterium]
MSWHEQEEVDRITRDGIAQKLTQLIERYDWPSGIDRWTRPSC